MADEATERVPGGELARRLAESTLALCAIPSVTADEERIASHVQARCTELVGLQNTWRMGNSVIAHGPRREGRPTIALFGHVDTVLPAAGQELEVRDGRVYGCGASDMKGGLAVMLELLAEAEALEGANLRCVFYDREEGPAAENGLEPLCQAGLFSDVDLALCLEPTDNHVQAGCVGGVHARVHFRGRRAHSARPWQGRNAIYEAIEYLGRLRDFGRHEVEVAGLRFYEVMNVTMAHTENSRNVIPDRFTLNINYRFAPGKTMEAAIAEVHALLPLPAPGADGSSGEPIVDVEIVDEAPSGAVCVDHPLLAAWRRRTGLAVEAKQAWTDVARLASRGIAAVNFGPGETAQAHQAHESIPIAHLVAHHAALRDLILGAR